MCAVLCIQAYKHYSKYATQALKALPSKALKNPKADMPIGRHNLQQMTQKMGAALPPQVLQQLGGAGGLQQFLKNMGSGKGGFPGGLGGLMGGMK